MNQKPIFCIISTLRDHGSSYKEKKTLLGVLLIRSIGSRPVVDTKRYTFVRATSGSQLLVDEIHRTRLQPDSKDQDEQLIYFIKNVPVVHSDMLSCVNGQ